MSLDCYHHRCFADRLGRNDMGRQHRQQQTGRRIRLPPPNQAQKENPAHNPRVELRIRKPEVPQNHHPREDRSPRVASAFGDPHSRKNPRFKILVQGYHPQPPQPTQQKPDRSHSAYSPVFENLGEYQEWPCARVHQGLSPTGDRGTPLSGAIHPPQGGPDLAVVGDLKTSP